MSAAATAAGYLYASGRLRGRSKEGEGQDAEHKAKTKRRELKVAVYEPAAETPPPAQDAPASRPRSTPKIQYRTRRWKPE